MTEDEREAIEGWLASTGFPLEHRVGEAMRTVGYRVRHGVHLENKQGDAREIDLLAAEPDASDQVFALVECKHASRPWIIRISTADLPHPASLAGQLIGHRELTTQLSKEIRDGTLAAGAPLFTSEYEGLGFDVREGPKFSDVESRERNDPY